MIESRRATAIDDVITEFQSTVSTTIKAHVIDQTNIVLNYRSHI